MSGVWVERGGKTERLSAWASGVGVTTHQALGSVLPGLLEEIGAALAEQGRVAIRLRLALRLESGASSALVVRAGRPTRSVQALERLVRSRMIRLRADSPIASIGIEVVESAPDSGHPQGHPERIGAREPLPALTARLGEQLGDEALFSPVLAEEWRPEAAWRPARHPPPRIRPREAPESIDPVDIQERRERRWPLPRPSLLLAVPEPVEVMADRDRPVKLRLASGWQRVDRTSGPERLQGQWWQRSDPPDREYWAVEVGGRGMWLFRDRADRWWLHGWFD